MNGIFEGIIVALTGWFGALMALSVVAGIGLKLGFHGVPTFSDFLRFVMDAIIFVAALAVIFYVAVGITALVS